MRGVISRAREFGTVTRATDYDGQARGVTPWVQGGRQRQDAFDDVH